MKRPVILLFGVLALLGLIYGVQTSRYATHFFNDTVINGIKVGNQTGPQAARTLQTKLSNRRYTVTENNRPVASFTSHEAGLQPPSAATIEKTLQKQNPLSWPLHLFPDNADRHDLSLANLNQTKLHQLAQKLVTTANQTSRVTTKDAQLTYQAGQFMIQQPVYGNQITAKTVTQALAGVLDSNTSTLDLKAAYVKPKVKADNPTLKKARHVANAITTHQLTFRLAGKTHRVPQSQVASWLTTQNAKLTLKPAKLTAYLTAFSHKYGTVFKNRRFKTTGGAMVVVPAGLYGWSINISATTKGLKSQILKTMPHQDLIKTPVIQGTGYHKNGTDIGRTYVEVSKAKQHMWVYKNGEIVISTAVVTGKPVKGTTPSGVYLVWNKQRHATLRGRNDNGSKYASKVNYWLPVDDTGVGIHDSPWQPKYGGTWYLTHGSHGCVNTPPAVMAKVYATVSLNTPVIIY